MYHGSRLVKERIDAGSNDSIVYLMVLPCDVKESACTGKEQVTIVDRHVTPSPWTDPELGQITEAFEHIRADAFRGDRMTLHGIMTTDTKAFATKKHKLGLC